MAGVNAKWNARCERETCSTLLSSAELNESMTEEADGIFCAFSASTSLQSRGRGSLSSAAS